MEHYATTLPGQGTKDGYDPEAGGTPRTIIRTDSGLSALSGRDAVPSLLAAGAVAWLGYLLVKGLTAKRPTLRAGYRRIGGKVYGRDYTYRTKAEATRAAEVERRRGYGARVLKDATTGRWASWVTVRPVKGS